MTSVEKPRSISTVHDIIIRLTQASFWESGPLLESPALHLMAQRLLNFETQRLASALGGLEISQRAREYGSNPNLRVGLDAVSNGLHLSPIF